MLKTRLPFILLCGLGASRWLLEGVQPSSAPSLWSESVGSLLAGFVLWGLGVRTAGRMSVASGRRQGRLWMVLLAGILVVTGPSFGVLLAGHSLVAGNLTLALALCPVIVGVFAASSREYEGAELAGLVWPGLMALAALLLLIPQPVLHGARPWVGLLAVPALVAGSAAFWQRGSGGLTGPAIRESLPLAAGLSLMLAAGLFASLGVLQRHSGNLRAPSALAVALDGLTASLTLWTLGRLGPVRWSVQFMVIPLVGLLEGAVLLRPFLDGRSYLAFLLLVLGAIFQWMAGRRARPAPRLVPE